MVRSRGIAPLVKPSQGQPADKRLLNFASEPWAVYFSKVVEKLVVRMGGLAPPASWFQAKLSASDLHPDYNDKK